MEVIGVLGDNYIVFRALQSCDSVVISESAKA